MAGIRIDALPSTLLPSVDHEFPAMKDGLSVKLTVAQVIALAQVDEKVSAAVAAIVAAAPGALDTLNELAAALGDDPNFAATVTAALGNRLRFDTAQALTELQQAQAAANLGGVLAGHIHGLTLSNNVADATNDIDIAVGSAASDDAVPTLLRLNSALTKRLDANWAVGTNQGGLDTGTVADGTYHAWLIRRPDTGLRDVLFSLSATAPTMPANYTQKRRIGPILRRSGAILGFTQTDSLFMLLTAIDDRTSTAAQATALYALTVPLGIPVLPILRLRLDGAAATIACSMSLGDGHNASSLKTVLVLSSGGSTVQAEQIIVPGLFRTNTSAQLYFQQVNTTGTPNVSILTTLGWIDDRGRNG